MSQSTTPNNNFTYLWCGTRDYLMADYTLILHLIHQTSSQFDFRNQLKRAHTFQRTFDHAVELMPFFVPRKNVRSWLIAPTMIISNVLRCSLARSLLTRTHIFHFHSQAREQIRCSGQSVAGKHQRQNQPNTLSLLKASHNRRYMNM